MRWEEGSVSFEAWKEDGVLCTTLAIGKIVRVSPSAQ